MRKTFTILAILDVIMAATGIVLYRATVNADNFSVLIVWFPLVGFIVVTIALLVLGFLFSLKEAMFNKKTSVFSFAKTSLPLIFAPLLGICYASILGDRHPLLIVSMVALICGIIAFIFMAKKNLASKSSK